MSQVLPSKPTSFRRFAAIALFFLVYLGVLTVVIAPRDLISVQSGSVIRDGD